VLVCSFDGAVAAGASGFADSSEPMRLPDPLPAADASQPRSFNANANANANADASANVSRE
jgi:hypothetical protein